MGRSPCWGALIKLSSLQNHVAKNWIKNARCQQVITINPHLTSYWECHPFPAVAEGPAPNPPKQLMQDAKDPTPADGWESGLPEGIPARDWARERSTARQPAFLSLLQCWLIARACWEQGARIAPSWILELAETDFFFLDCLLLDSTAQLSPDCIILCPGFSGQHCSICPFFAGSLKVGALALIQFGAPIWKI